LLFKQKDFSTFAAADSSSEASTCMLPHCPWSWWQSKLYSFPSKYLNTRSLFYSY